MFAQVRSGAQLPSRMRNTASDTRVFIFSTVHVVMAGAACRYRHHSAPQPCCSATRRMCLPVYIELPPPPPPRCLFLPTVPAVYSLRPRHTISHPSRRFRRHAA